jgi:hypothetical protein
MNLGEVRKALDKPAMFGIMEITAMTSDREVVVQVPVAEHPVYGTQYEYRTCRAIGALFLDGRFQVIIAAGEVVDG